MYCGGASGSPSGVVGYSLRITFASQFSGQQFTVQAGTQNIISTVPSSLYSEITIQTLNTSCTITCNGMTLTIKIPAYYGYTNVAFTGALSNLNATAWGFIRSVSDNNQGTNYWSVGDYKNITLSGIAGNLSISGTYRAFIIGFNHNSSKEGNNRIHFMIGKNSSGKDIAFCDSQYNTSTSSVAFKMNTSNTNFGGWSASFMRNTILGQDVSNIAQNSFMSVLPTDLVDVLKTCTKYTSNTGEAINSSDDVTATQDYLFLNSEWEIFAVKAYANQYEQNYQQQYAYFSAGNSKIKYGAGSQSSSAGVYWWLRSRYYENNSLFCGVNYDGSPGVYSAFNSLGVAPCFCV